MNSKRICKSARAIAHICDTNADALRAAGKAPRRREDLLPDAPLFDALKGLTDAEVVEVLTIVRETIIAVSSGTI